MGQRSQIIAKYNVGGKPKRVMLYNQWLYGEFFGRAFKNILDYEKGALESVKLSTDDVYDFESRLMGIVNVDIKNGVFRGFHNEGARHGMEDMDNNNGWLLLDFTGDTPKYGFVGGYEELAEIHPDDEDFELDYKIVDYATYWGYSAKSTIDYRRENCPGFDEKAFLKDMKKIMRKIIKGGWELIPQNDVEYYK